MSANGSTPSRVRKVTSAPSRPAATAWFEPLPPGPSLKDCAEDRLAHARLAGGAIGGVGDEDAEDDDRLAGRHVPYSASGGTTPLRKAKQP